MSAKQTPGRVKVQHPHAGPRGWEVAFEPGLEQLCQDITEDNARRLVACWNACEGINTELLENAPYKDSAAFMAYLKMEGQRDLMLAALREALPVVEKLQELIAKHHPGFTLRQTAIVRDAIASAEGGAPAAIVVHEVPDQWLHLLAEARIAAYCDEGFTLIPNLASAVESIDRLLASAPQAEPQPLTIQHLPSDDTEGGARE